MTTVPEQEVVLGAAELHALISNAPRLREHHLWLCAKVIGAEALEHGQPLRRRLAKLAEAEALIEAALLLASEASPGTSLASVRRRGRLWTCRMTCNQRGTLREVGCHTDLAAALMIACLQTCRRPRRRSADSPDRKTSPEATESTQ